MLSFLLVLHQYSRVAIFLRSHQNISIAVSSALINVWAPFHTAVWRYSPTRWLTSSMAENDWSRKKQKRYLYKKGIYKKLKIFLYLYFQYMFRNILRYLKWKLSFNFCTPCASVKKLGIFTLPLAVASDSDNDAAQNLNKQNEISTKRWYN